MNQFHRMSAVGRASWLRKCMSRGMVNSSALMIHFLNQMIPFLVLGKHMDGNSSAEKHSHYQVSVNSLLLSVTSSSTSHTLLMLNLSAAAYDSRFSVVVGFLIESPN